MFPVLHGHSIIEVCTQWSLGELYYFVLSKVKEREDLEKNLKKSP